MNLYLSCVFVSLIGVESTNWICKLFGFCTAKISPDDFSDDENTTEFVYHISNAQRNGRVLGSISFSNAKRVLLSEDGLENRNVLHNMMNEFILSDTVDTYVPTFGEIESTPVGIWAIGSQVALSVSHVIYDAYLPAPYFSALLDEAKYVVKYLSNCLELVRDGDMKNSLVREYAIGASLGDIGIAPEHLWLSGVARWNSEYTRKFMPIVVSDPNQGDWMKLCESNKADVRFMIIEKVGLTVGKFIHDHRDMPKLSFLHTVLRLGLESVNLMEKLHRTGIVHGDIHAGNVAFRNDESWDLVFVDFRQSASMYEDANLRKTLADANLVFLSKWELEGELYGYRDDAFRLFEMICEMLSFGRLRALMKYDTNLPQLIAIKTNLDYFGDTNYPEYVFDAFADYKRFLSINQVVKMTLCLINAMNYIRSIPKENTLLDYSKLSAAFDCAMA